MTERVAHHITAQSFSGTPGPGKVLHVRCSRACGEKPLAEKSLCVISGTAWQNHLPQRLSFVQEGVEET